MKKMSEREAKIKKKAKIMKEREENERGRKY